MYKNPLVRDFRVSSAPFYKELLCKVSDRGLAAFPPAMADVISQGAAALDAADKARKARKGSAPKVG
jgi:hypothetical protein